MTALQQKRSPLQVLRGRWRDQVFADLELTFAARVVGNSLAEFITMAHTEMTYRESGKIIIFPSQEALQDKTGASADTVRKSIAQLIERGHLRKLTQGNQFTGANRYRVIIKQEEGDERH